MTLDCLSKYSFKNLAQILTFLVRSFLIFIAMTGKYHTATSNLCMSKFRAFFLFFKLLNVIFVSMDSMLFYVEYLKL